MKPSLTPLQHKLTTRSTRAPVKKLVRRVSSSDFYASNQIAVTFRRRTFTLSQVLEAAYAPSTNRLRQMVATKYQRFCMARKLPPKQESSAVQWLASTGTAPSTQITYMGHLKAIIAPLTPLQQYKRGLYRLGATSEPTQAHPFSRHLHMASLLSKLPSQTDRVAAWLTWKTASRWDETSRLRGPAILVVSPIEIILSWGAHTKTSQGGTMRGAPHLLTVIEPNVHGLDSEIWAEAVRILRAMKRSPTQPLTRITTTQIREILRTIDTRLSAHSFKVGALSTLVELRVPLELVSRVGKHTARSSEVFSTTTLKYSANPAALARMLRTGEATRQL